MICYPIILNTTKLTLNATLFVGCSVSTSEESLSFKSKLGVRISGEPIKDLIDLVRFLDSNIPENPEIKN